MDKSQYEEMINNISIMESNKSLIEKKIYIFGHCNASEELVDVLFERGYNIEAVLDNNTEKHGKDYRGIPIVSPAYIIENEYGPSAVLIVTRFYETMNKQLRSMGYNGEIYKLVDYNTYAEYSLSEDTISRKKERVENGRILVKRLEDKYPGHFRIFCPFNALGDIYFAMSYLPYYMKKRSIDKCVICVPGAACAKVVRLFGDYSMEVFSQKELDAAIQAELFIRDEQAFIAHQDRPYVVNLHKALYKKCIPLDIIYRCGIYGLHADCKPYEASKWKDYSHLSDIAAGKAVILSPYAKSVTALPDKLWHDIIADYKGMGYQLFTNVSKDEEPLEGTKPIRAELCEMKSIVERAGTFIGIRSGLCDVIRVADCRKIALYPDYNYGDTKWKSIDMYSLEGWENIVVKEDFVWQKS